VLPGVNWPGNEKAGIQQKVMTHHLISDQHHMQDDCQTVINSSTYAGVRYEKTSLNASMYSCVMCLMQFNRYELTDGRISERDFAESLVVYAGYNAKRRVRMLKRVKKAFKDDVIVS